VISITSTGSFSRTESFLKAMQKLDIMALLRQLGSEGVIALSSATPMDTGRAAASWGFEVTRKGSVYSLIWTNSDIENGFPVVIMLQFGHGTGTGGYVQGYDFINPAMRPVFDRIADEVWKVVTSA
jgi:hypothetical protein